MAHRGALRRLGKEWQVNQDEPAPADLFALRVAGNEGGGDHCASWEATIQGPPNTPYAGGAFRVFFDFPSKYPHESPRVRWGRGTSG